MMMVSKMIKLVCQEDKLTNQTFLSLFNISHAKIEQSEDNEVKFTKINTAIAIRRFYPLKSTSLLFLPKAMVVEISTLIVPIPALLNWNHPWQIFVQS